MTFTYTGDPSDSDIDAIRFYCQDTVSSDAYLSDEEIQFLYDTWFADTQSVIYVASVAAETIAGRFAREVSYSADGVSVSGDQLQQKYNDLASSLRDLYKSAGPAAGPNAGGMLIGEEFDDTINPLNFSVGMNDNRFAGQQAYGGSNAQERPDVIE